MIEAWFPGQENGNIVGDLLFGVKNSSGKSPFTYPFSGKGCLSASGLRIRRGDRQRAVGMLYARRPGEGRVECGFVSYNCGKAFQAGVNHFRAEEA